MQNWKGAWLDDGNGVSQISYYKGETVKYDNIVYIVTSNIVTAGSQPPPNDMSNWNTVVFGSIGLTGTGGTSGTGGSSGTSGTRGTSGVAGLSGVDGIDGTSGSSGTSGFSGTSGTSGSALPTGGTSGQVLAKIDNDNFNVTWIDQTGGGGSGSGILGTQNRFGNLYGNSTAGINAAVGSYATPVATTTVSNRLTIYPFIPNKTIDAASLSISSTTTTVGAQAKILIYSHNDVTNSPGTKAYESSLLDMSTTGVKTVLTTFSFIAGTTYWLGINVNAAIQLRGINASFLTPLYSLGPDSGTAVALVRDATTLGSEPSTFDVTGTSTATQVNILIRP